MKLSDFDFDLPERLIATRPASPRSASRLLVATPDRIIDGAMTAITDYLRPGDRLVLNDTRVIPARLSGLRHRNGEAGETSARIEVTLLSGDADGNWQALLKPLKKIRDGEVVVFDAGLEARVLHRAQGVATLQFNRQGDAFDAALAKVGAMPLPPYIAAKRAADERDKQDYQTVWARRLGAVAAPTASLHFDTDLLDQVAARGVSSSFVTLHVGAGTFLPVKTDDIADHKMHAEWGQVSARAAAEINATKAEGGRIIPVGTTALRLIETATQADGQVHAWTGDTDIFIAPGYKFGVTDALITNFHLPKSTLMMLVSALMGRARISEIYDHAIAQDYRFFSYGDASILLPDGVD